MLRPLAGQRILTSEGAVFVVKAVVQDHLDPTFFLIQLVAEGDTGDWLAEPIEVFESDWEEWILAQGAATLLPRAQDLSATRGG